jgi:hypothetical protein
VTVEENRKDLPYQLGVIFHVPVISLFFFAIYIGLVLVGVITSVSLVKEVFRA